MNAKSWGSHVDQDRHREGHIEGVVGVGEGGQGFADADMLVQPSRIRPVDLLDHDSALVVPKDVDARDLAQVLDVAAEAATELEQPRGPCAVKVVPQKQFLEPVDGHAQAAVVDLAFPLAGVISPPVIVGGKIAHSSSARILASKR